MPGDERDELHGREGRLQASERGARPLRVGIDIGGTFTDVAMEVGTALYSTKVLTNYAFPEQAIVDAIETVATSRRAAAHRSDA